MRAIYDLEWFGSFGGESKSDLMQGQWWQFVYAAHATLFPLCYFRKEVDR